MSELQRQDMVDLGTLVLGLACRHPVTASTREESFAFLAQNYSHELHDLVTSLMSKPPSVFEVCVCERERGGEKRSRRTAERG